MLYADPKVMQIQQINFTRNQEQGGQAAMYFIIKEGKEIFYIFCEEL